MRARLREVKGELMRRRHLPIAEQGQWLRAWCAGTSAYYAVPDNSQALRRSATGSRGTGAGRSGAAASGAAVTWDRMRASPTMATEPRILHPWPEVRFDAITQGRSPVR